MKIAFVKKVISPEVGVKLAGYGPDDVSRELLDDLFMTMLCLEDEGGRRAVLISFDLLGMNAEYIQNIRRLVSRRLGMDESAVLMSCTHTHGGPHLRTNRSVKTVETEYLQKIYGTVEMAAGEIATSSFSEVDVYYYSARCSLNRNRRVVTPDNRCSFLPHCRDQAALADGICDRELGLIFFADPKTQRPVYIIGNYAAHPLAGHAPGLGGLRISADYPGAFRNYLDRETGAESMFLSGMAGNMVPLDDEYGREAIRMMGVGLAKEALGGLMTALRQPERFKLNCTAIQSTIEKAEFNMRKHRIPEAPPGYVKDGRLEMEVQLLSIGDICLVGVPGEVLCELGLEVKWHSPFRRTFLLYCSTGYFDYLCPGNALVAGGYEGREQLVDSRSGLKLVQMATDGAYKLFERTFDESRYPDNLQLPLLAYQMKGTRQ